MNTQKIVLMQDDDAIYGQIGLSLAQASALRDINERNPLSSVKVWVENPAMPTHLSARQIIQQIQEWSPTNLKSSKGQGFYWADIMRTASEIDEVMADSVQSKRVNVNIQAPWVPDGIWHASFAADLSDARISFLPSRIMQDMNALFDGVNEKLFMDPEDFSQGAPALLEQVQALYNFGVEKREDAQVFDAVLELVGGIEVEENAKPKRKGRSP